MGALKLLFSLAIFALVSCKVERPKGVSISKASFYAEGRDFTCLDGSRTIPFTQINDDYCDCLDGSDEPGTSACPNGSFHCTNAGHKPLNIPSSRVNDGICDCCDGTDEYSRSRDCENTCRELGRAAREAAEKERIVLQQGFEIYQQYTKQGFEAKQEKQARRTELERLKQELEATRTQLEQLKTSAEEPERIAKDAHAQRWQEEKQRREAESEKEAAATAFYELDTNKDSIVTVAELATHIEFDIDSSGDVSDEEAKEYLEDQAEVHLEQFVSAVWPNIKAIYRRPSDVTEQQQVPADASEQVPDASTPPPTPDSERYEDIDDIDDEPGYYDDDDMDEDEEYYDDEEEDEDDFPRHARRNDVSDDSVSSDMPEYDDNTKALIAEADKARQAYDEADKRFQDAEREISDIDKVLSLDLGSESEFFALKDQCLELSDREYTYKLCVFDRASQRSKSGGSETSLGKWGKWAGPNDNKYASMMYENGQNCWNGPNRSVKVHLQCGVTNELLAASEPSRCEYEFRLQTPAACADITPTSHLDPDHDEL